MDEEEQNQQEQQPQSAFNVFQNITSAQNRKLSTFSLFNRKQQESSADTRQAVQQNSVAIQTINTSLISINAQVVQLSTSLKLVSDKLQQSTLLENAKQAQEKRQEAMQNDLNIRRGKEGVIEKRIQGALFAPIQKIGARTTFTLTRLMRFFNLLLGGFLAGRALTFIRAVITKDEKGIKEIGDNILKSFTSVGAIFLAINGGLVIAIKALANLSGFLTRLAVTNLLLRPIQLVFGVAKTLAAAVIGTEFFKKYGRLPSLGVPPPSTSPGNVKTGPIRSRGILKSASQVGLLSIIDLIRGEDPALITGGAITGFTASSIQSNLGNKMKVFGPNSFVRNFGRLLETTSFITAGFGYEFGKRGTDMLDQSLGLNLVSRGNVGTNVFDSTIGNIRQGNISSQNIIVNPVPIGEQQVDAAQGRAALLGLTPAGNKDNPYLFFSQVTYNII